MASASFIDCTRGLEFTSFWVEQSVQHEIKRGEKLRQRKILQTIKEGDRSRFSQKSNLAPSAYPVMRKPSSSPKRKNGVDKMRHRARSNSPFRSPSRPSPSRGAGRGRPVCSMRITQLAVPTKRQCIETWRNKANILPGFMVHRLKQQVMDQTPIVKISDAVTCFKYDKPDNTTSKKRPQRKINKEAMRQRELENNQNLSVLFGNKLLGQLMKPVKKTVIPRLRKMSTMVADELCLLMTRKGLLRSRVDDAIHKQMIREISDKVTIWIAQILEDAAEKILEEDLREKKNNERIPATINGEVITLMNAVVATETELEEEEGPALDVLDDVVNNVLDICIPSVAEAPDDRDNKSTEYFSITSRNSVGSDIMHTTPLLDGDSINTHLYNQVLMIIDTIKSDKNLDFDDSVESHPNLEEKQSEPHLTQIAIKRDNEKQSLNSESFESITSQHVENDIEVALSAVDDIINHVDEKSITSHHVDNDIAVALSRADDIVNRDEEKTITSQHVDNDVDVALTTADDIVKPDEEKSITSLHIDNDVEVALFTADDIVKPDDEKSITSLHVDNDVEVTLFTADDIVKPDKENPITSLHVDNDVEALSTADDIVNPDEEKSSNVSDTLAISLSEEERNKKRITFLHDDIGHVKDSSHHSKSSNAELYYHTDKATGKVPSVSSLSALRNIYDTWPKYLSPSIIKPSASAIMSITSLGRILESEENNLLSIEVEVSTEQLTTQAAVNAEPDDNWAGRDSVVEIGKREPINESSDKANSIEQTTTDVHKEEESGLKQDLTDGEIYNEHKEELVSEKTSKYDKEPVFKPGSNDDKIADAYSDKSVIKPGSNEDTTAHETKGDGSKRNDGRDDNDTHKDLREIDTNLKDEVDADPRNGFDSKHPEKDNIFLENTIINKLCISHDSKHSLVSVMLFEMQKYGDKLKDIEAIREYISQMRIRCECADSDHVTQSEKQSSQMYQRHSRSQGTTAAMTNKFDFRVRPETAPSWLTCGPGEPGGGDKDFSYSGKNMTRENKKPIKEREREILKWCNDLDNILINLSKWKIWLDYITKYINTLKQKAELKTLEKTNSSKTVTVDQLKPPKTIDKVNKSKPNLSKRTDRGLKLYRNDETIKFKILPTSTTLALKHEKCVCTTKQTKKCSRFSRIPTAK